MIYNTIHHEIRNKADLSLLDYCLLESIHKLCNSKKATYNSWCNASKSSFSYLASKRTIGTRFDYLEKQGWIKFYDKRRYLKRTTEKYYNEIYCYVKGVKKLPREETSPVKELHPSGEEVAPLLVKKLHPSGEEVAPYNMTDNTIDNTIDNVSKKQLTQEKAVLEILVEQLRAENERLLKNQKDEKEKEKSSAKKEKAFVPVHQNQLFQKPYKMALANFNYPESWDQELINKFSEWCECQHEKLKGKFGVTNVKAIIRQINDFLNKHDCKLVAESIEYSLQNSYNKFSPQWVIDQQQKKKKDEQKRKEQQSSGGGLYDNWAQIVNNGINQHTDESGNGTIDTSWADAQH